MPIQHAPNAALLIDFDNVTLGVRSDLAKELRTLLNSEIIRGKVAVQRAYADWRRYPQYIVSLSESSIDLIFAPAFGTNKKNATDIRLAVDAIELVFTRPEIGTFILLSGDSDFSSLVVKLKEYGKYVIGVGIRESASDVLIQNCDEYYSYTDLAGLSKEADVAGPPRDPWHLVVEAVKQMAEHRDVMRADRLKQVMQQIDPAFDERNAGYNRFSKFVTEAGDRGLISVIKLDTGQLDVAPAGSAAPTPAAEAPRRRRGQRAEPKA
ncbi:MAG: NYN domain-containing protein, partial [Gemmatimonadales bacterium]